MVNKDAYIYIKHVDSDKMLLK